MSELLGYVKQLYSQRADEIVKELEEYQNSLNPVTIHSPNPTWYKYLNLYFVYPDAIRGRGVPLAHLIPHLAHVKRLGCNAVHILPFLDSPMVDKGFDVSDFMTVRRDLGGVADVRALMKEARSQGIRVFMDLVYNHVSDQHEWFRRAEAGEEKYRDYFIHQKTKPQFEGMFHKESAVWAKYMVNGHRRDINVAFPEYAGDIAHWRQGNDGYWYYHTYYPQQIDVNWRNPDVFVEFAKITLYWASMGFNFRLDAIPFVGKSAYKEVDNNTSFTRKLLASFRVLAEMMNPEAVFIVETYEKENTVVDYFGTVNQKQAQVAYNFHLCTYLWVALSTGDTRYLWDKLDHLGAIPAHAEWINFLRNHDELSLAYLDEKLLKTVSDTLLKNGASFREGYGISGRTYSLLGRSGRRFLNAYLLLSSLPGAMLVPYGDEVGKVNISLRRVPRPERNDTRSINRGILTKKELDSPKGRRIFDRMSEFLNNRQILRDYLNITPKKIAAPREVFAAQYELGSSRLIVLINIGGRPRRIRVRSQDMKTVVKLATVGISEDEVELGPYAGVWLQK